MQYTSQLRYEHELLLGIADALRAGAAEETPGDLPRLVVLLGQFSQLLHVHLLREDSVLYPALIASPNRHVAAIAVGFQEEMGGLDRRIEAFDARWTTDEIGRCWDEFRLDLTGLVDELRIRAERENEELYPLLEAREDVAA